MVDEVTEFPLTLTYAFHADEKTRYVQVTIISVFEEEKHDSYSQVEKQEFTKFMASVMIVTISYS